VKSINELLNLYILNTYLYSQALTVATNYPTTCRASSTRT